MALNGFNRNIKLLDMISDEEIENIHFATLDILKKTGVKFESKWALDFFKKNDCIVSFSDMSVRFPEGLVEECLKKVPSKFKIKAREEKNDLFLGGNNVYFYDAPGRETIDLNTFIPHNPSKLEYINYIKVLDALPNLHKLSAYPYFGFENIPEVMIIPEIVALKLIYSSKVQDTPYFNDSEIFTVKMAKVAGIEFLDGIHSLSPLFIDKRSITRARRTIEAGFPVYIANGCSLGVTSPATVAGSIVVGNSEIIAMIVFMQLMKPGTRIHVWDVSIPTNMKNGLPYFGQIQDSINKAIFNQIWRKKYKIPIANGSTGFSNAKNIGFQLGYEKTMSCIISALSGANLIMLHGGIYGELTAHPVQAVLDDDIAGMIGQFLEGVSINDETIALNLIEKIGQFPGNYLNTEHTRQWWKKEQYITKAGNSLSYPEWLSEGKKNELNSAKEISEEIINNHKPLLLEEEKIEEIKKILEEAKKYYKEKGML